GVERGSVVGRRGRRIGGVGAEDAVEDVHVGDGRVCGGVGGGRLVAGGVFPAAGGERDVQAAAAGARGAALRGLEAAEEVAVGRDGVRNQHRRPVNGDRVAARVGDRELGAAGEDRVGVDGLGVDVGDGDVDPAAAVEVVLAALLDRLRVGESGVGNDDGEVLRLGDVGDAAGVGEGAGEEGDGVLAG